MSEEPQEIAEIHIIPEHEDQSRHWRNRECWCEPYEGDPEDFMDIVAVMDECDEEYVILVHNITH